MTSNQTSASSQDEWSEHVAAWRASDVTRAEYCRQHGLKLNVFLYQVNRHRSALSKSLTLVPVKVQAAPGSGPLVLLGPKGWSLSLASDVPAAWLGELLGALS